MYVCMEAENRFYVGKIKLYRNRDLLLLNGVFELAATVPELLCGDSTVQEPAQILNFLRKQVRVDSSLSAHHFTCVAFIRLDLLLVILLSEV